jgi:hypothetical protein
MIMKKIFSNKNKILVVGLVIALSSFASCKKLIEIPANPPSNITRQQAFADSSTALSTVAGVYSLTPGGGGIPYQDGVFTFVTSLSGHDVRNNSYNSDETVFFNYSLTALNTEINDVWQAHYTEIYQVNDVLNGITGNSALSAPFIKQISGEMEFVRAYCYFNMVNLFGGVPLVTTTDYNTNAHLPRVTPAAIYTQIETDLNDAAKKLTATYPSAGHLRANLYTVRALQAKVNLYQRNWQAAYNEADSVIKSGNFNLETDLSRVFLDGSNEAIWQVPILNQYQGSSEALSFIPSSTDSAPNYPVTDSLINQFEPGDLRMANWLGMNVVNGQNVYYPAKYKDQSPTTPATDYMLLRYADIYLVRAEAAAQLNNLGQAITDINTVRTRAGLAGTKVDATSQTAVLGAVLKERRTEMFTEMGNRWFDLNRTSTDNKYPASGQAPAVLSGWQPFNALYAIPQTQRNLNIALTQNQGYH